MSSRQDLDQLILTVTNLNRQIAQRTLKQRTQQASTQLQHEVLRLLNRQASSVSEVARSLRLSLPSTTQVIQRLERARLIQRTTCPEDRRWVVLDLTPIGRTHLRRLDDNRRRQMRRLFAGVSAKQLRSMVAVLERMSNNLGISTPHHPL